MVTYHNVIKLVEFPLANYLLTSLGNFLLCVLVSFFALSSIVYAKQERVNCRIEGYPFQIECGYFLHQGIEVHWYRVAARVRYPISDPVIWIPDSFSLPSTDRASGMISMLSRMRNQRDFIWIDIRGKANSSPIGCIDDSVLSLEYRINRYSDTKMVGECWKKIHAIEGMKIFSVQSFAKVYEKLRHTLKLNQVTVVAEGRGAEIAEIWTSLNNGVIRYQIFDSPLMRVSEQSIQARSKRLSQILQQVTDNCLASQRCKAKYGNLYHSTESLINRLPVKTLVSDPLSGKPTELEINQSLFSQLVVYMLRNPSRSRLLPLLVNEAKNGNWQPFIGVLGIGWNYQKSNFDYGINIIEQCELYASSSKKTEKELDAIGLWLQKSEQSRLGMLCGQPRNVSIKSLKTKKMTYRIPTLILLGGSNSGLAPSIINSPFTLQVVAPGAGAGVLSYGCAKDVAYRFLRQLDHGDMVLEDKKLEADCLAKLPYPNMDTITLERLP